MKLTKKLLPTAILAIAASACGGGPDLDQVKKDFDNPTGSTSDKNGVIAASGKQEVSQGGAGLTGGGVPGFSLVAEGKNDAFAKLSPRALFLPRLQRTVLQAQGKNISHLRLAQSEEESCIGGKEFEEMQAELAAGILAGKDVEASASAEVDLSTCGEGLSGNLELSMEVELTSTLMRMKVEYSMDSVCETESGDCIDGAMLQEVEVSKEDGFDVDKAKIVTAWEYTAEWTDEDGKKQSVYVKGGVRIGYQVNDMGEQSSIEILVYVKDSSGEEVSYVLSITADTGTGTATLSVRGKGGATIDCAFNDVTGAGACTGVDENGNMFMLEWTDAEYDSITESEDFLED